ncbi:helix-turn-helix domain-containing protein [Ornithinimicrobium ciconiae]|uniref:Helix-turn-helix domain-containing protein n=1 Tax=Ornithinimicrobium ciconiae TaxID=2594265 RepID=A0A516GD38_9MICO|nr:helix-turn-helix domain-containing protein [Ornithinimicrobium ciconiae]QDO89270.1 helix-turn-helix domain-containing protein [Ornithinimicrobium ciconiae]
MHPLPHPDAASATIVLIVSSDAGERDRLRRCVPPGVAVHCVATEGEALEKLGSGAGGVTAARPVATSRPGVQLLPDGALVAGNLVRLTPLEHAMLRCLLTPTGSVWSLLALSEQVWGTSFVGNGSQVRAVLKRLRRKLLMADANVQIEAVRGRGLRLIDGP